jgi:hypothetical protein
MWPPIAKMTRQDVIHTRGLSCEAHTLNSNLLNVPELLSSDFGFLPCLRQGDDSQMVGGCQMIVARQTSFQLNDLLCCWG